jgi:cytochrome c biogenesis protein CcmG, thiol:disulfide interchange protein DsbE
MMKKTMTLALLSAALSTALSTTGVHAVEAGQPAPDFSLPAASGTLGNADLRGKLTYLDFWASWCGPCKKSFPWMSEMQARYGSRGFQVIAINLDKKREDADRFLAETPAGFKVAFDGKGDSARQFAIKGMPSSVLIGPDGRLMAVHNGFRDEDRKDLEARIAAALAAMPAVAASTR